jgi:RNA polymerase sigma-70 factor (ECF subfamily)
MQEAHLSAGQQPICQGSCRTELTSGFRASDLVPARRSRVLLVAESHRLARMTALWRSAFDKGRESWPAVSVPYERFCECLTHLGYGHEVLPEHADALYVCAASDLGDDSACRAIEARYFGALRSAIARVDGRKDFIDEVLQLLRVQLFSGEARKIARYAGRGPLERWLRTAAMRLAFRQKKARAKLPASLPDGSDAAIPAREGEADRPFKAAYARAFEQALDEAFQELYPRERAVLRLHFAEGMNIDEIGRVYAVHRATVARWIASCREGLARAVRARLEVQFGQLVQEEFDSLFRLVYQELDLSVTALLRNSDQFRRRPPTGRATHDE